jgi:hypothetical protein
MYLDFDLEDPKYCVLNSVSGCLLIPTNMGGSPECAE